jgi:hypothetical protein
MEQPCALTGSASTATPELPPETSVWSGDMVRQIAALPVCQRLPLASAKTVVVMRGSFRIDGSLDDLLTRIGAISARSHLRYWSVTDKKWLEFIANAHAVRLLTHEQARENFTAAELRDGEPVFYVQRDNRSSHSVIYRMQVRVTGPAGAVIEIENVTAIRYMLVPMFPPAALHSEVHLQRLAPDLWEILQIDWVGPEASAFARGHEASYVNRTAAMFRYIAGIPSNQAPPAAP